MREGGRFAIKGGPRRWATTGGLGRRARDVVLDGVSVSHRENVFGRPPDQRLVNFGCLTSIIGSVCSLGSKGFSVGARAASIELFQKWHSRHAVPHEGFHRASGQKTSPPIYPRGADGSTPFEAVVQPVGGARATCCQKRVHGAHARRKRLEHARRTIVGQQGHHRDVRNGLGAAEMPRRVEHTRRVARPTFRPCAQPLTHARTPALRQHPRTTQ